jgi:hypothetical protein
MRRSWPRCCCRCRGSASPKRPRPPGAAWPRCARNTGSASRNSAKSTRPAKPSSWPRSACAATNLLWEKANAYHKEEDWVNLSATLEQIARLQPNFVSVWIFQGWNLSYNISVQFDDYRDRYYWVIRGIDFLKEGTEYNAKEPRLLSKIGYTIANKIGRADERVFYRQLFRDDDDFHGERPKSQRDNWLVGREWMLKAEDAVAEGVPLRGESPLLFYSHPVMCLINYSEALQEDGTFGEVAKDAWRKADVSWREYSNRDLPTQLNVFARLSEMEAYQERSKKAQEELAKYAPDGIRETIMNEKIATLPEEQQALFKADPDSLSREKSLQLAQLKYQLEVQHMEVADRVQGENRAKALQAAADATFADEMARSIEVDRGIVNYEYWTLRCQIEPTDDVLAARKLLYDADQAFTAAELNKARGLYEQGLQSWRKVLDDYPLLLSQVDIVDQLNACCTSSTVRSPIRSCCRTYSIRWRATGARSRRRRPRRTKTPRKPPRTIRPSRSHAMSAAPGAMRAGPRPDRADLDAVKHDRLQFGHFGHGVLRPFLAKTAFLQPAVGHQVRPPLRSPVDVQVAAVDLPGELQCVVDVLGKDARGQSIGRVVGQPNRFVDGNGPRDGHGRTE